MKPTQEMIEAAAKAGAEHVCSDNWTSFVGVAERYVTAALAAMPQPEPVAWTHPVMFQELEERGGSSSLLLDEWSFEWNIPLFTTPPRDDRDAEIERLKAKLVMAAEALDTLATSFHGSNPSMAYADAPREAYLEHVLSEARRFARAALAEIKAGDA